MGNCKGLGAYGKLGAQKCPSDETYFEILQPYLPHGRIGMFMLAKCADKENIRKAKKAGLNKSAYITILVQNLKERG